MFNIEQFAYETVLGVRKEHAIKLGSAFLFVAFSTLYAKKVGLEVTGSVPAQGPTIYVFNHLDMLDPFRLMQASLTSTRDENGNTALARIPITLGKSTLFGIPEPENIQDRIKKKDILNSKNPFVQTLVRHTIGAFLKGNGVVPIIRGEANPEVAERLDKALKSNQTVATSIMESRDKTGGLKGIKKGAALLVQTHPDIPFQLIGISKDPARVVLGKPQTYAEIKSHGRLNLRDLTLLMADGIVDLLPEKIQERWKNGEREIERQAL